MSTILGRISIVCAAGLLLGLGSGCTRPETAIRERPPQRVEVIQNVKGMTPEEEQALTSQLTASLAISPEAPDAVAGPSRVFRLTLNGNPDGMAARGLGQTCLVSTGLGALLGALLPAAGMTMWTTWRSAALGTGAGALLGLGYGPIWYRHNASLQQELGYLPWGFWADWEVLERRPGGAERVVARSGNPPVLWPFIRQTPHLDLRPHLRALPPDRRNEAEIRRASLNAYAEALAAHFKAKS